LSTPGVAQAATPGVDIFGAFTRSPETSNQPIEKYVHNLFGV